MHRHAIVLRGTWHHVDREAILPHTCQQLHEVPACCPTTRTELLRGGCPLEAAVSGLFGSMTSAHAAECAHMPLPTSRTPEFPTLAEMTSAALARLGAAVPGSGLFLVVGEDRMDHAAHAGNAEATTALQLQVGVGGRAACPPCKSRGGLGDRHASVPISLPAFGGAPDSPCSHSRRLLSHAKIV